MDHIEPFRNTIPKLFKLFQIVLLIIVILGLLVSIYGAVVGSEDLARNAMALTLAGIAVLIMVLIIHFIINLIQTRKDHRKGDIKKVDIFVKLSLISLVLIIACLILLGGKWSLWVAHSITNPTSAVFTYLIVLIPAILMTIGVLRSQSFKKTKPPGFVPLLIVLAFTAFMAFWGIAVLAFVFVLIFVLTYYKYWKTEN